MYYSRNLSVIAGPGSASRECDSMSRFAWPRLAAAAASLNGAAGDRVPRVECDILARHRQGEQRSLERGTLSTILLSDPELDRPQGFGEASCLLI
jgi:hypothetical protein